LPFVNKTGCYALNAKSGQKIDNLLTPTNDAFLESDADEQLLLTLAFREPVKCSRITLTTYNDERAPKTIKVFVNRPSLDFADADRDAATQTFVLGDADVLADAPSDTSKPRLVKYKVDGKSFKSAELELHFVKFQKVSELTLFVVDNAGDDSTAITQLDVQSAEKQHMHVEYVTTEAAFDKLLVDAGTKTVFIDFTASWCGPCQKIAPTFQALSESVTSAIFRKVDVDANKGVATRFGVAAMPTFIAFKNKQKVAEMRGADEAALRKFVDDNK